MGDGHDPQQRVTRIGHAPGVTAQEIASAPQMGTLGVGKRNIVQTHEVGSQWIDHDAVCDGKDDTTAGCFLTDRQRLKLIIDFVDKAQTAQTNYKLALQELRVEALLEKDSDVNWLLTLVLDVLGAHFVSTFARALSRLKAGQLAAVEEKLLGDGLDGAFDPSSMAARMHSVLTRVPDKSIESYVKMAIDTSKRQGLAGLKKVTNAGRRKDVGGTVAYIDQLTDQCDVAFQEFKDTFRGFRNDAEMVAIWDGMQPAYHTVSIYKDALGAKLQRFKRSGVEDIGRLQTTDRLSGDADVYRDTRVIWLVDSRGNKSLWFQSQDGDLDYGVLHTDDPGSPMQTPEPHRFGPRDPREEPQIGQRVPDEFAEAAVLKSEAKWGPTPVVFSPVHELAARWIGGSAKRNAGDPLPRLQLSDPACQGASTAAHAAVTATPKTSNSAGTTPSVAEPAATGGKKS